MQTIRIDRAMHICARRTRRIRAKENGIYFLPENCFFFHFQMEILFDLIGGSPVISILNHILRTFHIPQTKFQGDIIQLNAYTLRLLLKCKLLKKKTNGKRTFGGKMGIIFTSLR